MKKLVKILSLLLTLVLTLSVFTACDSKEKESAEKVLVQWVQGQNVLKEEKVEKGTTLTEWIPEVEGATFDGWYETPYKRPWKFSKVVTESIRIYGKFLYYGDSSNEPFEMPDWYLIGAGKGDLSKSVWQHEDSAKNLGLEPDDNGIYRITVNLYYGDQFKLENDLTWDTEGYDCTAFEGFDNGVVKDSEGNVVFETGENNNVVVKGKNGKYEITFDSNTKKLGFTFVEELPPIPDDIRLNGDFRGFDWPTTYGEDEYKFTSDDGNIWTYEWEVTSNAKFKVYNKSSGVWYPGGTGNDLSIEPGNYTVQLNLSTGVVTVLDENGNEVDVGFTNSGSGEGSEESTDNPYVPTTSTKVYFVPNANWLSDGARFALYTWKTGTDNAPQWLDLSLDENGVYTATVPEGYGNVIFCRMNPEFTDNDWNVGDEDQTGEAKRVWSQTENLWIKESGECYFVMYSDAWDKEEGKATGAWRNDATVPERPSASGESVVYFVPNTNWLADGARFVVYYWNSSSNAMLDLVAVEGQEGVYTATIPAGFGNVIFCRMNPAFTDNGWNTGNEGENDPKRVWNQTGDYTLDNNGANYFVMYADAWEGEAGEWGTDTTVPETPSGSDTPGTSQTYEMYFVGSMNGWASGATESYKLTRDENGVWTGTLTVTAGTELKLYNKLDSNDGTAYKAPATGGSGNDNNLVFTTAGTYYFKYTEGTSSFKWWAEGEDEPEDLVLELITVYFKNTSGWSQVKAYWWGSVTGDNPTWSGVAMIKVEGTEDMYYIQIPSDITGLIFNNGTGTQTGDIKEGIADGIAWNANGVIITYNP